MVAAVFGQAPSQDFTTGMWPLIFTRNVKKLPYLSGRFLGAWIFSSLLFLAIPAGQLLIALAATLPRQIEMTHDIHSFTSGWNDLLSQWARLSGVASNMHPPIDPDFEQRIKIDHLVLREDGTANTVSSIDAAMQMILSQPVGRINVRGPNGSGKSTLLTNLKSAVRTRAYYWPTADRLAFKFAHGHDEVEIDEDGEPLAPGDVKRPGFSSGERQLRALQEIVGRTDAPIYLLDEWDANLDPNNRAAADALVEQLARRARVVEISHRDRI